MAPNFLLGKPAEIAISFTHSESLASFSATYYTTHSSAIQILLSYNLFF